MRELHDENFSIRYESNIPRQVGLAGSSAIIVATLRCLMDFYGVEIPREMQPSLVLAVETEELGLAAGLQDRVIQVYEGTVYMDFALDRMHQRHGLWCGVYEPLDPGLLPPLYVAYSTQISKPIQGHSDLRGAVQPGRAEGDRGHAAPCRPSPRGARGNARQELRRLGELIDQNFDIRRSICRLPDDQVEMIERARRAGATASFSGSGGAIVGSYPDAATLDRLHAEMAAIHCRVVQPSIMA